MNAAAFTSSWLPGVGKPLPTARPSRCPLQPTMTLLSHEKLEVISSSKEMETAKYKLEIEIPGQFSKERRRQSIQSVKSRANFPGFRKGTIPPYIMRDIDSFVLRDCCNELIQEAMKDLELEDIDGKETEADMDLGEMTKSFKSGEDFAFSCKVELRHVFNEDDSDDMEEIVSTDIIPEKVDIGEMKQAIQPTTGSD